MSKRRYLRWSKASGSTKRLIEKLVRAGDRAWRRAVSAKRRLQAMTERGGSNE
jgi:hypothetical protein